MFDEKARQLIKNVVQFMLTEKNNLGPVIPVERYIKRSAVALNISENTIRNILKEDAGEKELPKTTRDKKKKKTEDLPSPLKIEVRHNIYEMIKENEYVSLDSLLARLKERYIYDGGRSSLGKLVVSLGFEYKRDDNRRALCEKPDVSSIYQRQPGRNNYQLE